MPGGTPSGPPGTDTQSGSSSQCLRLGPCLLSVRGWPTVSPRFLRVFVSNYVQRRYGSSVRNFSDVPGKPASSILNFVSQTDLHLDHQPWIRTSNRQEKSVHETQIAIIHIQAENKPRHHFHYTYGSVRRPYPSYINSTRNHAGEQKNEAPTFQRRSADIEALTLTQHGRLK